MHLTLLVGRYSTGFHSYPPSAGGFHMGDLRTVLRQRAFEWIFKFFDVDPPICPDWLEEIREGGCASFPPTWGGQYFYRRTFPGRRGCTPPLFFFLRAVSTPASHLLGQCFCAPFPVFLCCLHRIYSCSSVQCWPGSVASFLPLFLPQRRSSEREPSL